MAGARETRTAQQRLADAEEEWDTLTDGRELLIQGGDAAVFRFYDGDTVVGYDGAARTAEGHVRYVKNTMNNG